MTRRQYSWHCIRWIKAYYDALIENRPLTLLSDRFGHLDLDFTKPQQLTLL